MDQAGMRSPPSVSQFFSVHCPHSSAAQNHTQKLQMKTTTQAMPTGRRAPYAIASLVPFAQEIRSATSFIARHGNKEALRSVGQKWSCRTHLPSYPSTGCAEVAI